MDKFEYFNKLLTFLSIPNQIGFSDHLLFIGCSCLILMIVIVKLISEPNLLESILYLSLFSLIICIIYLLLDAPDVAMTEAAIGVCLSTVMLLTILPKVGGHIPTTSRNKIVSAIISSLLLYCLFIAGSDFYEYGSFEAPIQQHEITRHYIENTGKEIGINSIVAAILASYRGFDTLGETLVIFTAAIIVSLILSYRRENVE